MLSFAAGDLEGFELLYRRHSQAVYRFFYFGTNGDEALASELFQDVWVTVVRGRVRYTNEITFTDWLYHSAWARLHDHLRLHSLDQQFDRKPPYTKNGKESNVVRLESRIQAECADSRESENKQPVNEAAEPTTPQKDNEVSINNDEDLLSCVSRMIPEHKEVVMLRFCFSMNNQEIADFLDVSRAVVDRTSRDAIRLLRAQTNSNS